MSALIIRTPLLKKISIECHNQALRSFMLAKDYKHQYEQLDLSKESIQLFQSYHPLHAVQVATNEYKFFSGWFWLPYCHHLNCDKISIIVHSKIEQYDIQEAAWAYLLSSQLQSFHRRNNLVQLKHYLDLVPDNIKKNLFNSMRTNSSQVIVQQLSNESRSAVRSQNKYFKHQNNSINKPSIRELLAEGNRNVS